MKQTADRQPKPSIALVGAGNLARALVPALTHAGYAISEIVVRGRPASLAKARALARKVGATVKTLGAPSSADVLWLCVRDDAVADVAERLASAGKLHGKIAFHSSGVLGSGALAPLKQNGARIAAVHPMMTFTSTAGAQFEGVWFGVEGDESAVRMARAIVGNLRGHVLAVSPEHKALYHAWGAFASPLLVSLLATAEQVARAAGISSEAAHEAILPLVRATIENYAASGAAAALSGPLRRGDTATVSRHLEALKRIPSARDAYVALVRSALKNLPVRNREQFGDLLAPTARKSVSDR